MNPTVNPSGITDQVNISEGASNNDEQWIDSTTRASGTKDPVKDADKND